MGACNMQPIFPGYLEGKSAHNIQENKVIISVL
jgi:hypothetical protein